jgi:abortive infection bacteriophage resistance protein
LLFAKRPTLIVDQLKLLADRGMCVGDHDAAEKWLETVGYYRLSAYWLPFESPPENGTIRSKSFKPGTTLQAVADLYVFDRRLRVLVLEAIERVEVHVRSRWTYHMAHQHGPHAHLDYRLFAGGLSHAEQLVRLARSVEKSDETFIKYYKKKYTEPHSPPLWQATELMALGELSKWFQATKDNSIKSKVGHDLGLPTKEIVEGILQVFSYVRNICAHHGRLWNRRTVKRVPKIKRFKENLVFVKDSEGQEVSDNGLYNVLVVLLHLIDRQATDSSFRERLCALIGERSDEERSSMGFPTDWQTRPIWVA